MREIKKEKELLNPIANYLKDKGYVRQMAEACFFDYAIDLYGYSEKKRRCVAIELKLYDWKKALKQALVYQLCADYVYVAFPESSLTRVQINAFSEFGIGFIAVSPDRCRQVLKAKKSIELMPHYKSEMIRMTKRGA